MPLDFVSRVDLWAKPRSLSSSSRHLTSAVLRRPRVLKPGGVRRTMKRGAGLRVGIKHRVCHAEDRSHHRFGSFVPEIAVVFDNAGIDLYIPIRYVHVADTFYLPKIQFAVCPVQGENVG